MSKKTSRGFTLIELLVVIAILGILAGLIMTNFVGVRQRGRDAQRKANIRQIQAALELYRADQGIYPATLPACGNSLTAPSPATTIYMNQIPCDPATNTTYRYLSTGSFASYTMAACLENSRDSDAKTSSPISSFTCSPAYYFVATNP